MYSFLYIQMMQNPSLYGIHDDPEAVWKDEPILKRRKLDLAHTATCLLEKSHLVQHNPQRGALQSTPMGHIASQYYVSYIYIALYRHQLRPNFTDVELLRLFSLSGEFMHITVREYEKLKLAKMVMKVPIPVNNHTISSGVG